MDHYTLSHRALRVPATLVFGGVLLSLVVGFFHPDGPANDHAAAFAEYAHSGAWIAVHLGQFVGMMVIVAGLLALSFVFTGQPRRSVWAAPFGAVAAVLALGLYGVLQAVDGVALKHAVDAWMGPAEFRGRSVTSWGCPAWRISPRAGCWASKASRPPTER